MRNKVKDHLLRLWGQKKSGNLSEAASAKFLWELPLRSWKESLSSNARRCPQSANLIGETWRKVSWSARIKPDESKGLNRGGWESAPLGEIYKPRRHKLPTARGGKKRRHVSAFAQLSSPSPFVIRREIYRNRFTAGGGHDRDIGLPRHAVYASEKFWGWNKRAVAPQSISIIKSIIKRHIYSI